MAKLKDFCTINPKAPVLADDIEVSFVPMPKVGEQGEFDPSEIREYQEVKKGFTNFQNGDVLFAKITPCMENGKGAIVRALKNGHGFGSTEFHVLRPDYSKATSEWIYYLTSWHVFRKEAEINMTGSAGQKRVPKTFLENYEINLPEVQKQKEMADTLDHIGNLIALRKEQLAKLDQLVKSRFVELFGDPETNPYGWKQTTVGEVCSSIVRGPFGSALKKEFFVEPNETTYKVYEQKHAIQKSATIGTYYITAEKFDELRRFECVAGDILMSCSGTMGELYQLPEGCEKGLINQALCKFTLNKKILPIVFLTYMKQTIGKLETKGSGIQNIAAVSYVKAMPINLAPMEVQKQFAAFVEQTDKSKLAIQQSLDKLELLKKSLMQKYFG